jgi:hypothetical protein
MASGGVGRTRFVAFCDLRLDFDVHLTPLDCAAPINYSPVVSLFLSRSSRDDVEAVLQNLNQAAGAEAALRTDRRGLIAWLGGRRPAKYCASNARRAAATVGPIPTIPSSTLGPSNPIQSSPRKNNRDRRTADGLPGWAAQ